MATTVQRVLELWRESERELAAQSRVSRNTSVLTTQIERLRRLYQTITEHEQRELREFKGPDRTIVRSESLALRSRSSSDRAAEALARARRLHDHSAATSAEPAPEPSTHR
jgi:hypothetical protein